MNTSVVSILRFFRHRGTPVLSALLAAILLPACSVAIAHSFKKVPEFTPATTRAEVHKVLGQPLRTVTINPPQVLRAVAPRPDSDWPSGEAGSRRAGVRDDFRLTGWYARYADKDAAATSGMSFGILEPIAIQEELEEKARQEKGVHDISIWYSPEGRYLHEVWKSTLPLKKWQLESEQAKRVN